MQKYFGRYIIIIRYIYNGILLCADIGSIFLMLYYQIKAITYRCHGYDGPPKTFRDALLSVKYLKHYNIIKYKK